MPNPHLSNAGFPKLTKTGPSDGTVTGSDVADGAVTIVSKNGKKTWTGPVGTQVTPPPDSTWNATVHNIEWLDGDDDRAVETVTVTVSNLSGPSNPVVTTSDIS